MKKINYERLKKEVKYIAISTGIILICAIGFLFYSYRDKLAEVSGYNDVKEAEEELMSFSDHFYNDFLESGVDANTMENSGDVIAMTRYDGDGNSYEEIQFIYKNHLINVDLENDSFDLVTNLENGPFYGLINNCIESYVLGRNRILYHKKGEFDIYKDQKWEQTYQHMAKDELYDALYDILIRQNQKSDPIFTAEEVAMVAYARNNGTLLRFTDNGTAYFAEQKGNNIKVYTQNEAGKRDLFIEVNDYSYKGKGFRYFMYQKYLFYLNDNQLMLYNGADQVGIMYLENTSTINHLNYMNDQNGDLIVYFSDNEKIYIHNMDKNSGIQVLDEFDYGDMQGMYSAGEHIIFVDSKALQTNENFKYKVIHVTPDLY